VKSAQSNHFVGSRLVPRQVSVRMLAILLIGALAAVGCVKKNEMAGTVDKSAEATKKTRTVNLAIWSGYISDEFLKEFEQTSGIKVNVSNFSSNEELLGKLQAGGAGYDLIVPSDYMVLIMSKLNLLSVLEHEKIKAFGELDPKVMGKPFDPANKFSIPYGWGMTGIAVNRNIYKEPVKSWKDLFDNPKIKGNYSLLDDARETIGAALRYKGFSMNSTEPDQLKKAKEILAKAQKGVKAFNSDTYASLVAGEVAMAHAYSVDALKARAATNGKVEFVLPKEGGTLWIDCLGIPAASQNKEEAYALVNFFLEARVNASRTKTFFASPVILGAVKLLPPELQKDPVIFPPASDLKRLEMLTDLGEKNSEFDRIWTEMKASAE
jgi:spermidine/putrescine transport system substrate-binding protein